MLQSCSSLFPVPYSLLCATPCREHDAATLLPAPTHFRECAKRDEKPTKWLAAPQTRSLSGQGEQKRILQN
jgi:hypothetical protein